MSRKVIEISKLASNSKLIQQNIARVIFRNIFSRVYRNYSINCTVRLLNFPNFSGVFIRGVRLF